MKQQNRLKQLVLQFIKFGIVGFSSTIISLGLYYLFVLINEKLYLLGHAVGFFVSVLNSFYWNSRYVFQDSTEKKSRLLLKTYLVYGTTFLLGSFFIYMMVNFLHISKLIAPLINLVLTVPLNFLFNKLWAYKS